MGGHRYQLVPFYTYYPVYGLMDVRRGESQFCTFQPSFSISPFDPAPHSMYDIHYGPLESFKILILPSSMHSLTTSVPALLPLTGTHQSGSFNVCIIWGLQTVFDALEMKTLSTQCGTCSRNGNVRSGSMQRMSPIFIA